MKSRAAADTALRLQPDLAVAHGARGYLLMDSDFDWMGMNAEHQRALQLAPNDALIRFQYGNAQAILGHPARAAALTREAISSDPLNTLFYLMQSYYQAALGQIDEARKTLRKALALQPDNVEYLLKMVSYETQAGNAKAAIEAAQKVPAADRPGALAMARQIGGDRAAADVALESAIKAESAYFMAELYGIRKEPEKMFASLERAWTNHDIELQSLLYDPFIVRYKVDPRFAAFCEKVGLPTTTTTKAMK